MMPRAPQEFGWLQEPFEQELTAPVDSYGQPIPIPQRLIDPKAGGAMPTPRARPEMPAAPSLEGLPEQPNRSGELAQIAQSLYGNAPSESLMSYLRFSGGDYMPDPVFPDASGYIGMRPEEIQAMRREEYARASQDKELMQRDRILQEQALQGQMDRDQQLAIQKGNLEYESSLQDMEMETQKIQDQRDKQFSIKRDQYLNQLGVFDKELSSAIKSEEDIEDMQALVDLGVPPNLALMAMRSPALLGFLGEQERNIALAQRHNNNASGGATPGSMTTNQHITNLNKVAQASRNSLEEMTSPDMAGDVDTQSLMAATLYSVNQFRGITDLWRGVGTGQVLDPIPPSVLAALNLVPRLNSNGAPIYATPMSREEFLKAYPGIDASYIDDSAYTEEEVAGLNYHSRLLRASDEEVTEMYKKANGLTAAESVNEDRVREWVNDQLDIGDTLGSGKSILFGLTPGASLASSSRSEEGEEGEEGEPSEPSEPSEEVSEKEPPTTFYQDAKEIGISYDGPESNPIVDVLLKIAGGANSLRKDLYLQLEDRLAHENYKPPSRSLHAEHKNEAFYIITNPETGLTIPLARGEITVAQVTRLVESGMFEVKAATRSHLPENMPPSGSSAVDTYADYTLGQRMDIMKGREPRTLEDN